MIDKRLGQNIWLSELLHSETAVRRGIDNMPGPIALANLETVTGPGLQRIRDILGAPVIISSGYRSPQLNKLVGGSKNSAHLRGLAADFTCPAYGTPLVVARRLLEYKHAVRWDQLIYEGTWLHVAWPEAGEHERGDVLTAKFTNGGVIYSTGIA